MDKLSFIKDHIDQINKSITKFKNQYFKKGQTNYTPFESFEDLKSFLADRLHTLDESHKAKLWEELKTEAFVKARIKDIAIDHLLYHSDLEKYYLSQLSIKLIDRMNSGNYDTLINSFIDHLEVQADDLGFKMIKSDFKKVFNNSLHFMLQRGFPENIENLNHGIMTANAGDSHQFLFLSRAILAGFECSNVDVRSSRYDAVIDYNNKLYKIQVKGISSGTSSVSFRDRARGGQGIDHNHERNKGKLITSKDCDVYAAVMKDVGIVYLIPMKWVDSVGKEQIKLRDLKEYKENWRIFDQLQGIN